MRLDGDRESPADTQKRPMQKNLVESEERSIKMGFASKLRGFLGNPTVTFGAVKEDTLGVALKYALICLVIFGACTGLILGALVHLYFGIGEWLFADLPGYLGPASPSYWLVVPMAIGLSIVGGMMFIFISGAWTHLWVYLLAGRKSHGYVQTLKALAYGATPACLVGWVPFIGGLTGGIWALVVTIIGLRELHGMTTGRAVAACLLPAVIVLVIILVLILPLLDIFGLFW
ncbi:YIP1 family protein [Candidatus Bathyarchaeota archaeon]|nr:YIP1 family protein [Candidatus Bathyarchaeota archaeon]